MGMMDRDYMRDTDRHKPLSPPPEKPLLGWLVKVLVFALIIYLGFKFANWSDLRARDSKKQVIESLIPNAKSQTEATPVPLSAPRAFTYPPIQNSPTAQTGITKCVGQGKVSYSDGACPAGAIASGVEVKNNHNLIAAVIAPLDAQVVALEHTLPKIAQANGGVTDANRKAECAALEAQIKNFDSMARQPQSGQTQDWIREERKKLRDRQARIPCM